MTYTIEALDLVIDAHVIAAAMAEAWLTHTREAIREGVRPDTGGPQKALAASTASRNRRSPNRGYKTGHLVDGLRRGPMLTRSTNGVVTHVIAVVEVPGDRVTYVRKEAKAGVVLLTTEGRAGEAALRAGRGG